MHQPEPMDSVRPNDEAPVTVSNTRRPVAVFLVGLFGGFVWTFAAMAHLRSALTGGDLRDAGLFAFYIIAAFLMLSRKPARCEGAWWEVALSWASAIAPMLGFRPAAVGWVGASVVFQSLGLLGLLASIVSLGRSFSIAPADRGLVTSGAYRYIRHPMYGAELLSNAGFLIGNLSGRNALTLAVMLATLVWRISREERVVDGYMEYTARVRWRLVPGIW